MKIYGRAPLARRILRRLGRQFFRWAENNEDFRLTHNGERWLLSELLRAHRSVNAERSFLVFDVGANVGDYTGTVLDVAREVGCKVAVRAFEPSLAAAARLREAIPPAAQVEIAGVALSDWTGEAPLHGGESGSSLASLVDRAVIGDSDGVLRVGVQRLDDYLARHAVTRVDLLKLDVEGSELAVLRGLGDQLRPEVVDVIQFEYGGTTRDARVSLRELHDLLVARGYVFAKLFPSALQVRTYQEWMDNFSYANYVALSPRWVAAGAVRVTASS